MRPRPVLSTNAVAGAVTGLAGILAFLGYANTATDLSGEAQGIGSAIAFLVPAIIHLITGGVAQTMVTPMADPQAHDGTPLVKATTLAEVNAQLLQPAPNLVPAPVASPVPVPVAVAPVPGEDPASVQTAALTMDSSNDDEQLPPEEPVSNTDTLPR